MSIQERITWAKRLTLLQIIILLIMFSGIIFFMIVGAGVAAIALPFEGMMPFGVMSGVFSFVFVFIVLAALFLPVLTYYALGRAEKNPWGVVAYACFVISLFVGNFTPLSLLPLIALIFLIDGPTFTYMTGSEPPKMSTTTQSETPPPPTS